MANEREIHKNTHLLIKKTERNCEKCDIEGLYIFSNIDENFQHFEIGTMLKSNYALGVLLQNFKTLR